MDLNNTAENKLYHYPNDQFESLNNFSGSPCPSKNAIEVLGEDIIIQIDTQLKVLSKERKDLCGKGSSLTGLAASQMFRNSDDVDIYCFNGLILKEENYAFPEKISHGNYTVMLATEFLRKEIIEVLEIASLKLEAERRITRLERMKKSREEF